MEIIKHGTKIDISIKKKTNAKMPTKNIPMKAILLFTPFMYQLSFIALAKD